MIDPLRQFYKESHSMSNQPVVSEFDYITSVYKPTCGRKPCKTSSALNVGWYSRYDQFYFGRTVTACE